MDRWKEVLSQVIVLDRWKEVLSQVIVLDRWEEEKMFHFWFNTFFVREEATTVPEQVNGIENADTAIPPPERSTRAMSYDEQSRLPSIHFKHPRTSSLVSLLPDSKMLVLRIDKWGLDDAHKDKQNKLYSSDFKVSVFLHRVSSEHAVLPPGGQDWQCSRQFQDTTPSESSEAESTESDEEEDGWESGDILMSQQTRFGVGVV
uniref:C2 tensin-type domain-containing protein n=1 Tax=Timema douglasi TaxID=61478 RepID=A0A7R8Z700_TIMDO|nr:unnamed protein product [Timema douglasi]